MSAKLVQERTEFLFAVDLNSEHYDSADWEDSFDRRTFLKTKARTANTRLALDHVTEVWFLDYAKPKIEEMPEVRWLREKGWTYELVSDREWLKERRYLVKLFDRDQAVLFKLTFGGAV